MVKQLRRLINSIRTRHLQVLIFLSLAQCVLLISDQAFAEDLNKLSAAMVQVKGSELQGNGVLILKNGELRVLTNSHIIKGSPLINVYLPHTEEHLRAEVEIDHVRGDIALLKIQPRSDEYIEIARHVLELCTKSQTGFCQLRPQILNRNYTAEDKILSVQNNVVRRTHLQGTVLGARLIDNFVVEGDYRKVWEIRALDRDGVSGGSYARYDGQFEGLVTKVSRGMQSVVFAIPADEIANSLREVKLAELNRTAVVCCAGGDPGNGGSTIAEPKPDNNEHWKLYKPGCEKLIDCPKVSEIINPFYDALTESPLIIGKKNGTIIRQSNLINEVFQSATAARVENLLKLNHSFSLVNSTSPEFKRLQQKRINNGFNLPWLRIWKKLSKNEYENQFPTAGSFIDGVVGLSNVGRKNDKTGRLWVGTFTPIAIEVGSGDRYVFEALFNQGEHRIALGRDLTKIFILSNNNALDTLTLVPSGHPAKVLFRSATTGAQALLVYHDGDLSMLTTFIIDTNDKMFEFNLQEPNNGLGL